MTITDCVVGIKYFFLIITDSDLDFLVRSLCINS